MMKAHARVILMLEIWNFAAAITSRFKRLGVTMLYFIHVVCQQQHSSVSLPCMCEFGMKMLFVFIEVNYSFLILPLSVLLG